MSEELYPGALLRLRTIRHYPDPTHGSGIISETWTAAKGKVFVVVVLGHEPQDGSEPLDGEQVMRDWGWEQKATSGESDAPVG